MLHNADKVAIGKLPLITHGYFKLVSIWKQFNKNKS